MTKSRSKAKEPFPSHTWDYDKSALFIPCQEAQQRFSAQIDLQELPQRQKQ